MAAHHLGNGGGVEARVPRVLALGREGEEEIDAGAETRELLEDGPHHLVGGPRVRRAFQDHQLSRMQVRPDRPGRVLDVRHVRLAVRVQRRGHAHDQRVRLRGLAEVQGGAERLLRLRRPGDAIARDVLDVAVALLDRVNLPPIDVEADDREALLAEGQRQRQPYVTQPTDPDHRVLRQDLVEQRRLVDLKHSPLPQPALSGPQGRRPSGQPPCPIAGKLAIAHGVRRKSTAVNRRAGALPASSTAMHRAGLFSAYPGDTSVASTSTFHGSVAPKANAAQSPRSAAMRRWKTPARSYPRCSPAAISNPSRCSSREIRACERSGSANRRPWTIRFCSKPSTWMVLWPAVPRRALRSWGSRA